MLVLELCMFENSNQHVICFSILHVQHIYINIYIYIYIYICYEFSSTGITNRKNVLLHIFLYFFVYQISVCRTTYADPLYVAFCIQCATTRCAPCSLLKSPFSRGTRAYTGSHVTCFLCHWRGVRTN